MTGKKLMIYTFFILLSIGVGACGSSKGKSKNTLSVSDTVKFTYSKAHGIGLDSVYNRRDPSDIIKVGDTYYIWYTRMLSPQRSGYWGNIAYATSTDEGHTWQEQGVALEVGAKGAFDSHSVFTPNILVYKGKFYLYYTAVKPTPGRDDLVFEGNSTTDITAIGLAVADSPDGPFVRVENNPVLEISEDTAAFDSYRIDDAAMLVKDNKIWMYYKGRSRIYGTKGASHTQMGLAFADHPLGPFKKNPETLIKKGHEVLVWQQNGGVASLASLSKSIFFAKDGLDFKLIQDNIEDFPMAPGLYRPHLEDGNEATEIPGWGIGMKQGKGYAYLLRFEMR